jgi:hypothetical protein
MLAGLAACSRIRRMQKAGAGYTHPTVHHLCVFQATRTREYDIFINLKCF